MIINIDLLAYQRRLLRVACGMVLALTSLAVGAMESTPDAEIPPPLGLVVSKVPDLDLPPAHPSTADVPSDGWQTLPQPRRQPQPRMPTRSATITPATTTATEQDCDLDGFAEKSGDDLVAHIRAATVECVRRLFSDHRDPAPERILIATFQTSNLLHVGRAIAQLAGDYDGTNSSRLLQFYLYLRTSIFFRFYNADHFDRQAEVNTVMARAIDAFVASEHYYPYNENAEHVSILVEVNTLMDNPGLRHRYIPVVRTWLERWTPRYAASYDYRRSVNTMFFVLYNGSSEAAFRTATASDLPLMEALRDFVLKDWMVGTRAEFMTVNAALELGRFLRYKDAPIYPTVRAGVKQILERYEMSGFGSDIWFAVVRTANLDGCDYYDICGFEATLEAHILSIEHACDGATTIRAQRLSEQQLRNACQLLARQDEVFHRHLRTNRKPVSDDFNTTLEVVVFADYYNYDDYSNLFFGNDTDNGGIYLEGNPANPENTARFIAYARPDLPGGPIWNLEHEQVHYLDGRFNMHGAFYSYRTSTHNTVWWLEGLAEYISKRDDNLVAVDLARTDELPLSQLFEITYDDGQQRVYHWSYLAVRFMFERHEDDVDAFLRFFRAGDYDGYLDYVNAIGERYDGEWRGWLQEVEALEDLRHRDPMATTTPLTLSLLDGANSAITLSVSEWLADIRPRQSDRIEAASLNRYVAIAKLQDGQLTIIANEPGTALVEVRVSNKWETVTLRFRLTVVGKTVECQDASCRSFVRNWRLWLLTDPGTVRNVQPAHVVGGDAGPAVGAVEMLR